MFKQSAKYYDLLKKHKDYEAESKLLKNLIRSINPKFTTLLDIACGTGEHDKFLKPDFKITGIDINAEFIEIARDKNPECKYVPADMTDFNLNKKFDVIVSLYGAIGYAKTDDNVRNMLTCFKRHLKTGGCLIIEPWYTPENWRPGEIFWETGETGNTKVCRMCIGNKDGSIKFHYLVGENASVNHFTEVYEFGLFAKQKLCSIFSDAGFTIDYQEKGIRNKPVYVLTVN